MNPIPKSSSTDSEALRQVWAWRESIHNEVAHLPLDEALRAIGDKAEVAAREFEAFKAARAAKASSKLL